MSYKLPLALVALAIIMLVGCQEPVGIPSNDVHVATVQMESCYVAGSIYSGHVDWYQGLLGGLYDHYDFGWGTITRAHYYLPLRPPLITWPHKNGFCIFTIPHFEATGGIVACTLYYFQSAHSGSASLLVNSWPWGQMAAWPPSPPTDSVLNLLYWKIWNSNDTVATDSTHATDGCWYKVPLTPEAYTAIADTAAAYQVYGFFKTGWVYRGAVDGTFTDVTGYDLDHPPFIRIWYDDGQ